MSSRFAMGGEHAISVDFRTTDYEYHIEPVGDSSVENYVQTVGRF